jgi:hypothetical protein
MLTSSATEKRTGYTKNTHMAMKCLGQQYKKEAINKSN